MQMISAKTQMLIGLKNKKGSISVTSDVAMPAPYKGKAGKTRGRKKGVSKYPFPTMKIGQSFVFPIENLKVANHVYGLAAKYGKIYGRKFAVRSMPQGYTVFRVA